MKTKCIVSVLLAAFVLFPGLVCCQEAKDVQLLKPQTTGGKPLMQALKERKSSRDFSGKDLSSQTLSNLLWSAFGVNRPGSGMRTAPSAVNWQEIDVYAATANGLYLYDAKNHALRSLLQSDIRPLAGLQQFMKTAPVVLIYVADYAKMGKAPADQKNFYSAADTGFISQNVYLFCASEGLATVVVGMVDKPKLAKAMDLRTDQQIILTQPVGYPKK